MSPPTSDIPISQVRKMRYLIFRLVIITLLLGLAIAYIVPAICIGTLLLSPNNTVQIAPINILLATLSFIALGPLIWDLRTTARKIGDLKKGATENPDSRA